MKKFLSIFILSIFISATYNYSNVLGYCNLDKDIHNEKINLNHEIMKKDFEMNLYKSLDQDNIVKYNNLSETDKNKLINYLTDYKFLENVLNTYINTNENKIMCDGDIEIICKSSIEKDSNFEQNIKATYTRLIKFLGLDIIETVSWVSYTHDGKKILYVNDCNHFTSRCYPPLLSNTFTGKTMGKTDKKAYSTSDVSMRISWQDIGPTIVSGNLKVWGDIYNNAGGEYTRY